MLGFVKSIVKEQITNDGISVVGENAITWLTVHAKSTDTALLRYTSGAGLGLPQILHELITLYSLSNEAVTFFLNVPVELASELIDGAMCENVAVPPRVINNEVNAPRRMELYETGGCLFITSRVLIQDLLKHVVPCDKVRGIVVYDAHKVHNHDYPVVILRPLLLLMQVYESSTEAFILRIFRQHNKTAFIKAFTDKAPGFNNGYCKVEKIMSYLFVKKLYLWPRFHVTVGRELEANQPEVIELYQALSPAMVQLQNKIVDAMRACLQELRRTDSKDLDDFEDVTLETALSESFDRLVKSRLEAQWHKVSPKMKQLGSDLSTLRRLLLYLLQYDSVTFYELLQNIRASSSMKTNSIWLFMDEAHLIYHIAESRVFSRCSSKRRKKNASGPEKATEPEQKLVLESPPKWNLLLEVLSEIRESNDVLPAREKGTALVLARDIRTCNQLRSVIANGVGFTIKSMYERSCVRAEKVSHVKAGTKRGRSGPSGGSEKGRAKRKGKEDALQQQGEELDDEYWIKKASTEAEMAIDLGACLQQP